MQVAFEDVSFVYHRGTSFERKALSNVTLSIPSGSFTALIGHTGSGKSTMIQLLNGLLQPTAGTIRVGEHEWSNGRVPKRILEKIRRIVGVVFQYPEHQLFEETVEKDVMYGPLNLGLPAEMARIRAKQAMEAVGLPFEAMKDRSPFHLSGGEMRRVAIAGVLAMQPKVLVLDEPTAGLDPQAKRQLLDTIMEIHRREKLTTVLVTHQMEEAATYADQIVVLAGGQAVLQGAPEEVFLQGEKLRKWALDEPEAVSFVRACNEQLPVDKQLPLSLFQEDELVRYLVRRIADRERGAKS